MPFRVDVATGQHYTWSSWGRGGWVPCDASACGYEKPVPFNSQGGRVRAANGQFMGNPEAAKARIQQLEAKHPWLSDQKQALRLPKSVRK